MSAALVGIGIAGFLFGLRLSRACNHCRVCCNFRWNHVVWTDSRVVAVIPNVERNRSANRSTGRLSSGSLRVLPPW